MKIEINLICFNRKMRLLTRLFGAACLPLLSYGSRVVFADEEPEVYPRQHQGKHKFIVIGETGVGKSTVINMITNYLRGGALDKLKVAIPTFYYPRVTERFGRHTESNIKNRSQAQTQKATEYRFVTDDCEFCVIDTPGLNDTAGIEQDDRNMEIIVDAVIQADQLSAIVLIMNGTEARITPNIKMLLDRLKGTIPDSITSNIVVVMTMCRPDTCNFVNFDDLGVTPTKIIHMNNTAFSSDPKTWKGTPSEEFMRMEWRASMESCYQLLNAVETLSPISTNEMARVKEIRNQVKIFFHDARNQLSNLQQLLDAMEKQKIEITKAGTDKEASKNFTVQRTIKKTELIDAPHHSTICAKCNQVCHDGCGLQEMSTKGDQGFIGCLCMDSSTGKCTVCSGHCSYLEHYHARKTVRVVDVQVDEEIQDLKAKFLAAQTAEQAAISQLDQMTLSFQAVEKEVADLQDKIREECKELKSICRNFNFVDEMHNFIDQLEKEALQLRSLEARKSADDFIVTVKKLVEAFSAEEEQAAPVKKTSIDKTSAAKKLSTDKSSSAKKSTR